MDKEKEYYSLTKKQFAIWAPFYDIFNLLDTFVKVREKVVEFSIIG
ncbi:MAG: hypothetical protein KJ893_10325 [Candidatus Omnitrophica bacterium]|nr:hypothetical protein [Candidatus Omnitrophota bacterium]